MKLSAVKYLSDAILSKRYNIDVFELHDAIQNAYLIEKELINKEISDEEIQKQAKIINDQEGYRFADGFIEGAEWYREQLKSKK